MAEPGAVRVSVVLAEAARQEVVPVYLAAGGTAWTAVEASKLLEGRSDLDPAALSVAVYGKQVGRDHVLEEGDRVEILRPLPQDPKLRRRQRARNGGSMGRVAPDT